MSSVEWCCSYARLPRLAYVRKIEKTTLDKAHFGAFLTYFGGENKSFQGINIIFLINKAVRF